MLPAEPSPREQQASFIDFLTLLLHDEVERRARRARNADDRTNGQVHSRVSGGPLRSVEQVTRDSNLGPLATPRTLLDHLIRPRQDRGRDGEAEPLG
jgi:hypothetical protein